MTVRKLISLLKKMPQHLEVGVSAHDNSEWEIGGWPCSVVLLDKRNYTYITDEPMLDDLPDRCVNIHC